LFGGEVQCGDDTVVLSNALEESFARDKVLKGWAKVGAGPLTRACLNSKKVRHNIVVTNDGEVNTFADPSSGCFLAWEDENKAAIAKLVRAGFAKAPLLEGKVQQRNVDLALSRVTVPNTLERQIEIVDAKCASDFFLAGVTHLRHDDHFIGFVSCTCFLCGQSMPQSKFLTVLHTHFLNRS
jgi:hypothetical protein